MQTFTANDVKQLRTTTGAGMLDAKNALAASAGNRDTAIRWLRERGLTQTAQCANTTSTQGAIALSYQPDTHTVALAQLLCQTDFAAKTPTFNELAQQIATTVTQHGEDAAQQHQTAIQNLGVALRENVQLGGTVRFQTSPGNTLGWYLHTQAGHGVNGTIIEITGENSQLAHTIAMHIAYGQPQHLSCQDIPAAELERELAVFTAQAQRQGKPAAIVPQIAQGQLRAWLQRAPGGILLEQHLAGDDRTTVQEALGQAAIVRYAQLLIH